MSLDVIRKAILALNARAQAKATFDAARRLAILAIRSRGSLASHLEGLSQMEARHLEETSTWVSPEALENGEGGRYDALDLRHWLALASRAGVPAVPARVILELSEDEVSLASGTITLPPALAGRLSARVREELGEALESAPPAEDENALAAAREALDDRLADAMDDVPEGWMVRHARCGASNLKALAGMGIAGPTAPEVRFGADIEVGPGWIRRGNRRRVDVADKRIVEAVAQGPAGPSVFLARPWVQAARWAAGPDPHRHGTQFAGKGMWPAEWRAFVENGRVIGVSSYYAWCGSPTPENARIALEVRALAQRMVDEAARQNAVPVFMDVEFVRDSPHFAEVAERFPRDAIACTLDFIETDQGLLFLEGGPPFTPVGGGHPCGFAGLSRPEGVAFRVMSEVILADPRTWRETDRSNSILSWEDVETLAAGRLRPLRTAAPPAP